MRKLLFALLCALALYGVGYGLEFFPPGPVALDVQCDHCVTLPDETVGNYVASANTAALTGLAGGSSGSAGANLSLAFDYSATLAGNPALAANNCVFSTTGLICEGATADAIETSITVADPTVIDKTITFPNETGTVCTTGSVCSGYQAALTNPVTGTGINTHLATWTGTTTLGDTNFILTGATAARTFTFPDTDSTVAVLGTAQTFTAAKTFQGSTPLIVNTSTGTDDQIAVNITTGGAARFTGTITAADLTGARTYTFPNETGTFCTTGSVCSGYQAGALTGDVTTSGAAATIANAAVTYAKMQNVSATSRFLGRITAGAGSPEELTGTQATTLLDAFTSTLKGLVPSSGGGTTNFLRADGTFAAPASITTVRKTLDETVNNSSTLQNDDELFLAIAANETWYFQLYIGTVGNATADFKLAFTVPTGATLTWSCPGTNVDEVQSAGSCPQVTASGTALSGNMNGSAVTQVVSFIGIVVNGGTAGNLQVQWAQGTATVVDTKVVANSYLQAHK